MLVKDKVKEKGVEFVFKFLHEEMNCYRNALFPGLVVDIVLKHHQKTGQLTRGVIKDILTKSDYHPRGIKVRLEKTTGNEKDVEIVGRVVNIIYDEV